jgi:uncharacterized membrane protein
MSPATDRPSPAEHERRGLGRRIAAIDWMRGFVMVLMAVDHASQMWNAGRLNADSAYLPNATFTGPLWVPGAPLEEAQFFTRWITHLCAPTFLFLSGTSLAMSFEKRRAQGMSERELDLHLLIRAGVVLACEALLSLMAGFGIWILQVLFAIGTSMIAMVLLRRLPTGVLVALALAWLAGSELVLGHLFPIPSDPSGFAPGAWSTPALLLFVAGYGESLYVLYPMTHWLAMMVLGWAFGRFVLEQPATRGGRQQIEKLLLLSGLSSLLLWAFLRSRNGYGNMGLLRDDSTIVQWLHMSKYPPALTYSLMELGLMALFLVVFLRHERVMQGPPRDRNPLLVFGQTALFFYMLHFILLGASAISLGGGMQQAGLRETWIAAALVLVVLYPVCIAFRALKRRYPNSVLQFI